MTPRLPTEILAQILNHAQGGKHPLARRSIRWVFKQVCRDWYFAQDELVEICLQGADQVERMTKVLWQTAQNGTGTGLPLGRRVKSAYFGMNTRAGAGKAQKVVELLAAIPLVEKLEFKVVEYGLARQSLLGDPLCKALGNLEHVKHFAIINSRGQMTTSTQLELFLPKWTKLESIIFQADACDDKTDAWDDQVSGAGILFNPSSNLQHVDTPDAFLLANLPPSVLSLAVTNYFARIPDAIVGAGYFGSCYEIFTAVATMAPRLVRLELSGSLQNALSPSTMRGYHTRLLSHLRDVRHLVIPAFAAQNLADDLSSLAHLEHLEVTATYPEQPMKAITADEVVDLISNVPTLARMTLPAVTVRNWSANHKRAVTDAAALRGVRLIDV